MVIPPKVVVVQFDLRQLATAAGHQSNFHGRQLVFFREPFAGCGQRHLDIEVAFRCDDLKGHDKEDQELEDNVDHGRHHQFDFFFGMSACVADLSWEPGTKKLRLRSFGRWCPGAESNHRYADFQGKMQISDFS